MSLFRKAIGFSLALAAIYAATIDVASAATFQSLVSQGYKSGGLTQNKAGIQGWLLKKGNDSVFCRMNVSLVYVGKNGMASFTAAGRMITIDKKTYMDYLKITNDPTIPHLEDLKAGRPRPEDAGSCSPVR